MRKYFAAANTQKGFVSWFDSIFNPRAFERTYIIKGGSGTGKSTLMKIAAERAEAVGGVCEYFHCSSDPASLDGLIINFPDGRRISLLDGTAPHTTDPKYPGAYDEIINLGSYWCDQLLTAEKDNILRFSDKKSRFYKDAYRSLSYAGTLYSALLSEISPLILREKLDAACTRLILKRMHDCHLRSGAGAVRELALSAITSKGEVYFDSFSDSEAVYAVSDLGESGGFLFDALVSVAKRYSLSYDLAPMPLIPSTAEAIRFPELSMSIVRKSDRSDAKIINMARFVDRDGYMLLDKARRKSIKKAYGELILDATEKLSLAARAHADLEKIYTGAMDFSRLEEAREKILSKMGI